MSRLTDPPVERRVVEGGLGHTVTEEGLVVVLGQLGQLGEHLLHAHVLHLARPPPSGADQPGLLQVVFQLGSVGL